MGGFSLTPGTVPGTFAVENVSLSADASFYTDVGIAGELYAEASVTVDSGGVRGSFGAWGTVFGLGYPDPATDNDPNNDDDPLPIQGEFNGVAA